MCIRDRKHIVTAAHYNGKIPRNPFAMYHVDPDHKEREFLTLDELTAMTEMKMCIRDRDEDELSWAHRCAMMANRLCRPRKKQGYGR